MSFEFLRNVFHLGSRQEEVNSNTSTCENSSGGASKISQSDSSTKQFDQKVSAKAIEEQEQASASRKGISASSNAHRLPVTQRMTKAVANFFSLCGHKIDNFLMSDAEKKFLERVRNASPQDRPALFTDAFRVGGASSAEGEQEIHLKYWTGISNEYPLLVGQEPKLAQVFSHLTKRNDYSSKEELFFNYYREPVFPHSEELEKFKSENYQIPSHIDLSTLTSILNKLLKESKNAKIGSRGGENRVLVNFLRNFPFTGDKNEQLDVLNKLFDGAPVRKEIFRNLCIVLNPIIKERPDLLPTLIERIAPQLIHNQDKDNLAYMKKIFTLMLENRIDLFPEDFHVERAERELAASEPAQSYPLLFKHEPNLAKMFSHFTHRKDKYYETEGFLRISAKKEPLIREMDQLGKDKYHEIPLELEVFTAGVLFKQVLAESKNAKIEPEVLDGFSLIKDEGVKLKFIKNFIEGAFPVANSKADPTMRKEILFNLCKFLDPVILNQKSKMNPENLAIVIAPSFGPQGEIDASELIKTPIRNNFIQILLENRYEFFPELRPQIES